MTIYLFCIISYITNLLCPFYRPRMMTMNGHLIFQTGTNHNITFRSTGGGYVNIDGENVQQLASLVSIKN